MIEILKEQKEDYQAIEDLLIEAFKDDPYSDHLEHDLVKRLRASDDYISDLALVAKIDDEVVGFILLSPIEVVSENSDQRYKGLALAPVAVLPKFQKKGIGAELINRGHSYVEALGYQFVVLLGHPEYYPRFGYETCSKHGIHFHFQVPDHFCMVKELVPGSLAQVNGMVQYPEAFF
ncbi:MAG: GNAT family N-acetyltransferase [Flavobacteriaceae bacterium]